MNPSFILFLLTFATFASAFAPIPHTNYGLRIGDTKTALFLAAPVGPVARLKKLQDPKEYNRVVAERIKESNMTKEEAEADYNAFLENPPFYYALEKKVSEI